MCVEYIEYAIQRLKFQNIYLWGQFLLQGQGLDLWNFRHFCCPTLERLPPSFYLIRHEPIVEEYHYQTSGTLQPLVHVL